MGKLLRIMADLRTHTVYSIVVDRFSDGDSDNNLGKCPECTDNSRSNPHLFWGGDLQGIIDRLDYLSGLGVGVLRLSSIFEQVPALVDVRGQKQAGFRGQWPLDMRRIDQHLLPRDQWDLPFDRWETVFDQLLRECHRRGIQVIIEVTCDHVHPGGGDVPAGQLRDDGRWLLERDKDVRGWFRRSTRPSFITDGSPIDEESANYRAYLRGVLFDWMERGVDGFSFDGVHRLPIWFWQEVTASLLDKYPDAILCGLADAPVRWEEASVDVANLAGLRLIDVALRRHLVEALAWHDVGGLRRLARYFEQDDLFEDATLLTTYLDRSDLPRLLSEGVPENHLLLALVLLMTARGIPCLLYGSEQGLHDDTEGGQYPFSLPMMDSFELDGAVPKAVRILADLRRDNLAVQRGSYRTVWESDDVLAYVREHNNDHVLVVLNRGPEVTIDLATLPFPNGPLIDLLGSVGVFVEEGKIHGLAVSSGGAMVFAHTDHREVLGTRVVFSLTGYSSRFGERVVLIGDSPELGGWDLEKAVPLEYVNRNLWIGDVTFTHSCDKHVLFKFAVVDERGRVTREARSPRVGVVPASGVTAWTSHWT